MSLFRRKIIPAVLLFFVTAVIIFIIIVNNRTVSKLWQVKTLLPEVIEVINKGLSEVQKGQWAMANNYFQEALSSAPLEPAIIFNIALAYDRQGKDLESISWYWVYLALQSRASNAIRVRQRINDLEKKVEEDARKLINKSREIIAKLPDAKLSTCCGNVVRAQLALGDIQGAIDAHKMLLDGCGGGEFNYRDIVREMAESGMVKEARMFANGLNDTCQLETGFTSGRKEAALAEIAGVQADKGDIKGVKQTLSFFTKDSYNYWILRLSLKAARGLVKAEKVKEAKEILLSLTTDKIDTENIGLCGSIVETYREIIRAQVKDRDLRGAKETLQQAMQFLNENIDSVIVRLPSIYYVSGEVKKGEVNKVQTATARYELYSEIAYAQALTSDIEGAKKTLDMDRKDALITPAWDDPLGTFNLRYARASAYRGIVQAYLNAKKFDEATVEAGSIENSDIRDNAYKDIVLAQTKPDNIERAKETARLIEDTAVKDDVHKDIALTQAASGERKGAQETIGLIEYLNSRLTAENMVSSAYAKVKGKLKEAEVYDIYEFIRQKEETDDVFARGLTGFLEFLKDDEPEVVAEELNSSAYNMLKCVKDLREIDAKRRK